MTKLKTQIVTQLKNSNRDKTQQIFFVSKLKNKSCDKTQETQVMTKLKKNKIMTKIKN